MVKPHHYDDDDEKVVLPSQMKFKEFDCPGCNANNPCDPRIGTGDEVLCNYCGCSFSVQVNDEGKMKLREI